MEPIKFDFPLRIVKTYKEGAKGDEKWYIEGYAATDDYDLHGDIITEDALRASENDLLENSTVLYNHRDDQPIGKVVATRLERDGLWIKVLISKSEPDIWHKITEGVLNKFSIGAKVLEATKDFVEDLGKVATIIKSILLVEVSLVAVPANPKARALNWYIDKALKKHEQEGGEIPMAQPLMKGHATEEAFAGTPEENHGVTGEDTVTDDSGKLENGAMASEIEVPAPAKSAEALKEALEKEELDELGDEGEDDEVDMEEPEDEVEDVEDEVIEEAEPTTDLKKVLITKGKKPEALLLQAMKEPNLDDIKALVSQAIEGLRNMDMENRVNEKMPKKPAKDKEEPKKSKKPTKTEDKPMKKSVHLTKSQISEIVEKEVKKRLEEEISANSYSRKGLVNLNKDKSRTQVQVEKAKSYENPEDKLKALLSIQHSD